MSTARHTTYNVIGALVPVLISLITIPLYLRIVGLERYGVLNLFWLLVGYFNLFDFGLGRATAQHIASSDGQDGAARSRAFWTGLSLSGALALLGTFVALPIGWMILTGLRVGSPALHAETTAALPLLVTAVPLAIIQSVLKGAMEGRQQFFTVNLILSVAAVATATLPLIATAIWAPTIPMLVAVSLAVRCVMLFGLAIAAVRTIPVLAYERPHRRDVRNLVRFGAWLTVSNVVGPLMVFLDRFLIGLMIGAAAVALYAIPFNLISQLVVLPASFAAALFPRFAASGRQTDLNRQALFAATFVLTPLAMASILTVGPFLQLWIDEITALSCTPIAIVLIVGFWANGLAQLPYASLQANARTDLTAKAHIAEALPYFLLLWFGLRYFGVVGAAVAWTIRGVVDFILLSMLDRIGIDILRSTLFQGAAILLLAVVMLGTDDYPILRWALAAVICLATAIYLLRIVPTAIVQRLRLWATTIT